MRRLCRNLASAEPRHLQTTRPTPTRPRQYSQIVAHLKASPQVKAKTPNHTLQRWTHRFVLGTFFRDHLSYFARLESLSPAKPSPTSNYATQIRIQKCLFPLEHLSLKIEETLFSSKACFSIHCENLISCFSATAQNAKTESTIFFQESQPAEKKLG